MTKYIDCFKGNNNNDGSLKMPWQSFAKITDDTQVILLSNFNTELNLYNKKNIKITGSSFNQYSLNPTIYQVPIYIPKYTKLKLKQTKPIIDENPTFNTVGSNMKIDDIKYKKYMQQRIYNVGGVISINLINCTNIIIDGICVSPIYNTNFICHVYLKKGINLNNCENCVIRNCELFSEKSVNTKDWSTIKWNENIFNIIINSGMGNRIMNTNVYNCGGIQIINSIDNILSNNFIDNYPRDGIRIYGDNNLCCNNRIANSNLVKNEGDSMIKIMGNNIFIINNILIAYSDTMECVNINKTIKGITLLNNEEIDTIFENCFIKNNLIYTDNIYGITYDNYNNTIIDKNTLCSRDPESLEKPLVISYNIKYKNIITNNILNNTNEFANNINDKIKNNYSLESNTNSFL